MLRSAMLYCADVVGFMTVQVLHADSAMCMCLAACEEQEHHDREIMTYTMHLMLL